MLDAISKVGGLYEILCVFAVIIDFILLDPIEDLNFMHHWNELYDQENKESSYIKDYFIVQLNRITSFVNCCEVGNESTDNLSKIYEQV